MDSTVWGCLIMKHIAKSADDCRGNTFLNLLISFLFGHKCQNEMHTITADLDDDEISSEWHLECVHTMPAHFENGEK